MAPVRVTSCPQTCLPSPPAASRRRRWVGVLEGRVTHAASDGSQSDCLSRLPHQHQRRANWHCWCDSRGRSRVIGCYFRRPLLAAAAAAAAGCPQLDKLVNALSGRTLLTDRICFEYRPPLCRNRVVERCSLTLVRVASNANETFHSSEINLLLLKVYSVLFSMKYTL